MRDNGVIKIPFSFALFFENVIEALRGFDVLEEFGYNNVKITGPDENILMLDSDDEYYAESMQDMAGGVIIETGNDGFDDGSDVVW